MKKKITTGFVIQDFNDDGRCISQEFIASDDVQWEDENGDQCHAPEHTYQMFDMVQPG